MKMQAYSIYDKKVQVFCPPFYMRADVEVERAIKETMRDKQHTFYENAEDYEAWSLGEWDNDSGFFSGSQRVLFSLKLMKDLDNG